MDTEQLKLILAFVTAIAATFVLPFTQLIIAYRQKKGVEKLVEEQAAKVEKIRTTLETSNEQSKNQLNDIRNISTDTHTLVNSNMGVQLRLHAATAKRLAEITKDKDDYKAAELAQQMVLAHERKQQIVDDVAKTR